MSWKIPLFKILWDEEDIEKVNEVIRSGMSWAVGPYVEKFEGGIAEYIGVKYAVAFNSGTSALHAVLLAYGISKGDEIIVPSFTFISTANCALFVGAKPVFAEIEESTYGLDPKDVERRITPRTKAIIPIHYGGCPCFVEELRRVAKKHGLLLIEDAAEAFGAEINGKKAGSFGDAAILSFCQNKIITTGEGGAVVTNSELIYDKLKLIRSHGRRDIKDYFLSVEDMEYVDLGYNFRMSNIIAALGVAQMKKTDKAVKMRRANAQYMNRKLSQFAEITIPVAPEGFKHVYQIYTIRIKDSRIIRDKLKQYLSERGIMAKVYFNPVHLTQFYRQKFGYKPGELPLTERVAAEVLTLPMYAGLTKGEMEHIALQIKDFLKKCPH